MGSADILFFAFIAIVIFARLWSVLGRRNDEDPDNSQLPNPFLRSVQKDDDLMVFPGKAAPAELSNGVSAHGYALSSLAGGLDQVKTADPSFDEKGFLSGARAAFTSVLRAFADQDLDSVARFLSPAVLASFAAAIDDRKSRGEVLENRIVAMKDAEITAARVEDGRAFLMVRFETRQTNVIRKQTGEIVRGAPDQIDDIEDKWVFARDLSSADPNWQLIETRG